MHKAPVCSFVFALSTWFLALSGGSALADNGPAHQAAQARPISLGTSGGNILDRSSLYCCSGTLGGLVEDDNGIQYILSNNHVLGRANQAVPGEPVNQPGMIDQGCLTDGIVGEIADVVPLQFRKGRSVPLNVVDGATAHVVPGAVRTDGNILDIGGLSAESLPAYIGQAVQKSGRTTGHTFGVVQAVDVTVDVGYSKECGGAATQIARFVNQITISDGAFSAGGDSGSVIVEAGTGPDGLPRAVGLLFAGSDAATIANPIDAVLSALNVSMVPGTPPPPPAKGSVSGTVVDVAQGSPIAGATVSADSGQSATTDANGAYLMADVPVGSRVVSATASGFASSSQVVEVAENATVSVDFAMEPQAEPALSRVQCVTYDTSGGKTSDRNLLITVRVTDDLGNSVANAVVSVSVTRDGAPFGAASAATDSNGGVIFSARNAPTGVYVTTVENVAKAGLAFDGSTPANAFRKGIDAVPLAFCLEPVSGIAVAQPGFSSGLAYRQMRQIKARHSDALFNLPNVVGHGISLHEGRPVIEVYLGVDDAASRRQIPAALEGVPVRVVVTGPFRAF